MIQSARFLKIYVESNEKEYNTKEDWNLYIQNFDCIGAPEQYTNYVQIPGANQQVDLSEALTGRPVYIRRELKIELGGISKSWPMVISEIRNNIDGRVCRLTFSDDPEWFYRGRVHVGKIEPELSVGKFTIEVPECEPYKYYYKSSEDIWTWDDFNFVNGITTEAYSFHCDRNHELITQEGRMYVTPTINVKNLVGKLMLHKTPYHPYSTELVSIELFEGENYDPRLQIGYEPVRLVFEGTADVEIVYRGGSL